MVMGDVLHSKPWAIEPSWAALYYPELGWAGLSRAAHVCCAILPAVPATPCLQ